MNLLDLFKNTELKLIEKRNESGDNYVFHFEPQSRLHWKAGQAGIFRFKGEKLKGRNFRILSVASSGDEKNIIIATRIGENSSEFKAKLKFMEVGDSIFLRGPFGAFTISDFSKNIALIAGGIGITPMRAILKDLENREIQSEITLFYVNSRKNFVFKDDLQVLAVKNPKIKILFLGSREEFKVNISEYLEQNTDNSLYYISGSPKMVNEIKEDLKVEGVQNNSITNRKFLGYK